MNKPLLYKVVTTLSIIVTVLGVLFVFDPIYSAVVMGSTGTSTVTSTPTATPIVLTEEDFVPERSIDTFTFREDFTSKEGISVEVFFLDDLEVSYVFSRSEISILTNKGFVPGKFISYEKGYEYYVTSCTYDNTDCLIVKGIHEEPMVFQEDVSKYPQWLIDSAFDPQFVRPMSIPMPNFSKFPEISPDNLLYRFVELDDVPSEIEKEKNNLI